MRNTRKYPRAAACLRARPTPWSIQVVINQAMARAFWPNRSPLGQMFSQGSDHGPWKQVIGVVNDVRQWGLAHKPVPEAYDAFVGDSGLFLVLHTSGSH
jgi:hypothetical protein